MKGKGRISRLSDGGWFLTPPPAKPGGSAECEPLVAKDQLRLVSRITELTRVYGRYGYRGITASLRREGWWVNTKRAARIWREPGFDILPYGRDRYHNRRQVRTALNNFV